MNLGLADALVASLGFPTLVAFTETWLDRGTESVGLTGYHLVSRLDRRKGAKLDRGGIILYARDGFELSIVHVANSDEDERSWHVIHSDCGPISLCVWYRRPEAGEVASIQRFQNEFQRFSADCVSTIVIGDMNVHNPEWLRWSTRPTPEGTALENVCCEMGLEQFVQKPTRGENLLDLVLSDLASGLRTKVTPGIHDDDHWGVLASVDVSIPSSEPVSRKVYNFKKANWQRLRGILRDKSWEDFFVNLSADDAAEGFTKFVLDAVNACIPSRWMKDKVYAHPWLNDACRDALRRKHAAVGTPAFPQRRDECTQVFRDTHRSYVDKVRGELKSMSPSSRGWWKLSSTLLTKAHGQENIPPLKCQDGSWATAASDKAAELSRVFKSKSELPSRQDNEYSALGSASSAQMPDFLRLRVRTVRKILKNLDEFSGTGPDLLPTRVLKRCFAELALPVTLLTRALLRAGRWPQCWRTHWVQSIYKRGSRAEAKNYRGVHLTPQLSKVVERAVGSILVPWLEQQNAYGPHQYAYSKGKGYKDVLTINVCSWILAMESGDLVALYCSDVSGAFDRVPRDKLGNKLRLHGLHPDMLKFLESWLQDRVSEVVVGGRGGGRETLCDSVFQGTVLGSPLWNVFYADAREAVGNLGFTETVFADDFNCFKKFQKGKLPQDLRGELELRGAQKELHRWGEANQVLFDPAKGTFHLLHRRLHSHGEFKILGVLFDTQLLMHAAARQVATEAGWRLQKLLKARRYFTTPELVHLYKAQVLSFIESSTPGLFHAAPSVLDRIDRVQRRLLRELGLDELAALHDYRLAPLPSRRDIAMLGVLHKVTLDLAPPQLADLFLVTGLVEEALTLQRLRYWRPLHTRQLHTHASFDCSEIMRRSLFGLVHCYNRLPQRVVDTKTVKSFQGALQQALKRHSSSAAEAWQNLFSTGWKKLTRVDFDKRFA